MNIPSIGLGTYQLLGDDAYNAVVYAIKENYNHIDTAKLYKNEMFIGQALTDLPVSRSDLFITTKVLNKDQMKGYDRVLSAFEKSLSDLKTDYVDLLLLHAPIIDKLDSSWKALEYLYTHGKCKVIGVSNFEIEDLEHFNKYTILPAVNQIELSPFYTREKLVNYCREKEIIIEAHTSLTRGQKLDNPVVVDMAKKYSISPAQVMLKWARQNDYIIVPRSCIQSEIKENINLPEIDIAGKDMEVLNNLDEGFALTKRR